MWVATVSSDEAKIALQSDDAGIVDPDDVPEADHNHEREVEQTT